MAKQVLDSIKRNSYSFLLNEESTDKKYHWFTMPIQKLTGDFGNIFSHKTNLEKAEGYFQLVDFNNEYLHAPRIIITDAQSRESNESSLIEKYLSTSIYSTKQQTKKAFVEKQSPSTLDKINTEIKDSTYILSLREGWDGEDAIAIETKIYISSIQFLRKYSKFVLENFGIVIQAPEINPCRNGSIDLSWRTKEHRMLINIKAYNGKPHVFFYMDSYNNKKPIKGNIPADEFEEALAIWMKKLV